MRTGDAEAKEVGVGGEEAGEEGALADAGGAGDDEGTGEVDGEAGGHGQEAGLHNGPSLRPPLRPPWVPSAAGPRPVLSLPPAAVAHRPFSPLTLMAKSPSSTSSSFAASARAPLARFLVPSSSSSPSHPPCQVRVVQHKQTRQLYALKYINKAKCVKMKAVPNIIQERRLLEEVPLPCLLPFATP